MDTARQEYPTLLSSLEPEQAVDVLNGRVALIYKIDTDIADWLQERRKVEEQYAASLRKLSRRPQQDNATALGVFQKPWQRIVNSTENMAQSHETLAAKIQADVEAPLRQYFSTNREFQSMGNMAGNLSSMAKEIAIARKKAQKLDAKGSNKVEGAQSTLDEATSQWQSQAPFVFEQLQALDEGRVNHLRDVLTQFQTHELDQVERSRASAESCLNALLNVETADEISTFATKVKQQAGTSQYRQDSLPSSSGPTGANVPPTPPPPRHSNPERNSSISNQDRLTPLPEPPKEKKLSGLKRLGTVMGRRKSAVPPPVPAEKRKEKTLSFAPFRRQESSRSFQDLETPRQDLSPAVSRDDRTSSRHEDRRPPQTQESRLSDAPSPPALNGASHYQTSRQELDRQATGPQIIPAQPLVPENNNNLPPSVQPHTTSPDRTSRTDLFSQTDAPLSPVEESARNFEIKAQPIPEDETAAQLAMSNMANQLRMQGQNSGLGRPQGSVRGRRDVRNTMFVPSPAEMPTAITNSSFASPSTPASTTATTATTAPTATTGRSIATPTSTNASDLMTPVKRSLGTGTVSEDASQIGSDTHSVHSARSTAGALHQEMHSPGLNASIVETVNTWFSDTGITRSYVVGEVALAYNRSTNSSESTDQETVRLQNFHQLEKCAQNPAFVASSSSSPSTSTSASDHIPGTYAVNTSSISRPMPSIAFKYQLHLDDAASSKFSPFLLTQAWQILAGQASIILGYKLNPAFAPLADPGSSPNPPPKELMLRNVAVTIALDTKTTTAGEAPPPRALSAQMMPVQNAHFKKRSSSIVWRFPELLVKPEEERFLARFTVEGNGLAKRGGIDVKFEVPGILASALGVERLVPTGAGGAREADPFADEDGSASEVRRSAESGPGGEQWDDVQSRKVLVAGKYTAS